MPERAVAATAALLVRSVLATPFDRRRAGAISAIPDVGRLR
jgi:hypothetical protein